MFYFEVCFLVPHQLWCGNLFCKGLYKAKCCSVLFRLWWIEFKLFLLSMVICYPNLNLCMMMCRVGERSPGCWSPNSFLFPLQVSSLYLLPPFPFYITISSSDPLLCKEAIISTMRLCYDQLDLDTNKFTSWLQTHRVFCGRS